MWPERIGKIPGCESRLFDGDLWVHAKFNDIEKHLHHGLTLRITTGAAKGHEELSVFHRYGWIGCQSGSFPGL